jgi:hypothetical protein
MPTALERQYVRLERQRAALFERLGRMSDAQQTFRPGPEAWSVAEVVQHLVLVEEAMVRNGRRQSATRPAWVTVPSWLRGRLMVRVLGTDLRVRAPNPAVIPRTHVPVAELASRWAAARQDLRAYVEGMPEPRGWRTAFFHPRTGWIGALGGLRFFEAHCGHHLRQIDRLLAARDFPR